MNLQDGQRQVFVILKRYNKILTDEQLWDMAEVLSFRLFFKRYNFLRGPHFAKLKNGAPANQKKQLLTLQKKLNAAYDALEALHPATNAMLPFQFSEELWYEKEKPFTHDENNQNARNLLARMMLEYTEAITRFLPQATDKAGTGTKKDDISDATALTKVLIEYFEKITGKRAGRENKVIGTTRKGKPVLKPGGELHAFVSEFYDLLGINKKPGARQLIPGKAVSVDHQIKAALKAMKRKGAGKEHK